MCVGGGGKHESTAKNTLAVMSQDGLSKQKETGLISSSLESRLSLKSAGEDVPVLRARHHKIEVS